MTTTCETYVTTNTYMYAGCDCNYDLCDKQRNNDYMTWKWFDYCLYSGIEALSGTECGQFQVYSGLNGVKVDRQYVSVGYFKTYVSTSWRKDVAERFMGGGEGMMLSISEYYKNGNGVNCCDVSWISKFPDECEILFARALFWQANDFSLLVTDESKGVQSILLTIGDEMHG